METVTNFHSAKESPVERTLLDGALGLSPDPYVNKPIRVPLLTKDDRANKKHPEIWDMLCEVVEAVEGRQDPEFTANVFRQVLLEIYRKLSETDLKYDIPLRVSLSQAVSAIDSFLQEQSGGDRPLAVTAALFRVIGKYFGLFDADVKRGRITASDVASGQVADIECVGSDGQVVIAVEVKDRIVTISDLEEKLPATRKRGVREVFFVSAKKKKQRDDVAERIEKEFAAGQNLYVFQLTELAESVLALSGEESRREFVAFVGAQLDQFSDTKHRLAWRNTLERIQR